MLIFFWQTFQIVTHFKIAIWKTFKLFSWQGKKGESNKQLFEAVNVTAKKVM